MTKHRTHSDIKMYPQTLQQSSFCFLGLLQCGLLSHGDVRIEVFCFLDAIQTLPTQLCRGDSSLPERQRHLQDSSAGM